MAKSPLVPKPAAAPKPEIDPEMAMILEEIDQDVKAKQAKKFFKEHGKTIAAVILAVILGTATASVWNNWQAKQQEKDTEKLITLLDQEPEGLTDEELKGRLLAYVDMGKNGSGPGHRILARLAEAGTLFKNGQSEIAIERLRDMQKDTSIRPLYRDYALLMELRARMDKDDAQKVLDDMRPLLDPKNPWYLSALEASAVLYAKMGKNDDAVAQLRGITDTEDAPLPVKERANQLMRLYTAK